MNRTLIPPPVHRGGSVRDEPAAAISGRDLTQGAAKGGSEQVGG